MNKEIVFAVLTAAVTSMVFMAGWGVKNRYTQTSNVTSSMTATLFLKI